MSTCGYHSPSFSEDIAWLPQWLQPYRPPAVVEHCKGTAGVSSPCCENCVFIGGHSQERQHSQNLVINAGGSSGFILHLSGDEETAATTPISSNVLPFSLNISESGAGSSPAEGKDNPQILNSGTGKGPSEGFSADAQEQDANAMAQNQFEAKEPEADKLAEVCEVASKEICKPLYSNRHKKYDVSGGKVDVWKLRNADINDAIELSIAASEAMVIAEMILDDPQSGKLAAGAIEAALHVKEARKQFYFDEIEHACRSSEHGLDETDWLAELDDAEMADVIQDVGLSLDIACSSQYHYTGDLKQEYSHPSCPPCNADADILGSLSSEKRNKRSNRQNVENDDHVSDSLAAAVLPNEPTPCYHSENQAALGKSIPCSRNKRSGLQASTQNNAALLGILGALVTNQNIHKEVGGVAGSAQMHVGTKKRVKSLFKEETSFISESISMDECHSTSKASFMEIVASSRASFHYKAEGLCEGNQGADVDGSCCQVVCSSLSLVDPLCSIVPCSISYDEGPNIEAPVCKQSEGNEGPTTHFPECEQNKGEDKEFMYSKEFPRMQDLDREADPLCVPLVKSPESNVPFRRRKYSSLRPFSTIAPQSNILGGTSTYNADVAFSRQEKFTPINLSKNIQRVQAAKEFIENNSEPESLQDFSLVQKNQYHSQDASEQQIREKQIQQEVCLSAVNLNVSKHPKRKRVQFSEAKLSSRRTKSNRRMLTKSRFSRSESKIEETLETSGCIDNKEAIFQGIEFLLTGFRNQKEKEIESLIRKCGGYVLSKVPLFSLDRRKKMTEFPSWKPPIVLSPKKVSTAKFLYGCAIDAWLLNPNWLFDSLQASVLLPPEKYLIRRRNALKHGSGFGHSLHPKCNTLIFDGVGFLIHGKISFCSKFSNIIKHGGGQVFISLQALVQSLKDGSTSHGIILVASEASASRHLSHCGLEHDIKTAPASWITGSLFSGRLIPLKKDRCASFRRIKMPSFQHVFDMSQEI